MKELESCLKYLISKNIVINKIKMNLDESESGLQRNFGYCQIHWEIENYFSATCKKNWVIYSPEFSVRSNCLTTWRLFLKSAKGDEEGESVISICLERLESDFFPGTVRANWELWYPCGVENVKICEKESVFERKSCFPTRIKSIKRLENWLQFLSKDKLCIEGLILVQSTEDNVIFKRSTDLGLKSLSQDMGFLYKLKFCNDVSVDVGFEPFICHKAILSVRNKKLQGAIEMDKGEDEINLDWYDIKSTDLVFGYLYSGNLDYVLRRPSISMDRTIKFFGMKELETYYMRDEINLLSKFDAIKVNFKWLLTDFESPTKTFFTSPEFCERNLNLTFQMYLHAKGDKTDYLGVSLEVVHGSKPQELFLKFELMDIFGISAIKRAIRWSSDKGGNLEISDFASSEILKDPLFVGNGALCITCTLVVPNGSSSLSVFNNRICKFNRINYEEHYVLLSSQIASLLETGKHSDLILVCGEERFKVHKCILSTRSLFFRDIIKLLGAEKIITIPNFNPNILRIILGYIYSGLLNNCDICDVFKVYATAENMVFVNLKNKCSSVLKDNLQLGNIVEAVSLAYVSKDYKLKVSCFNFIMHNIRETVKQDNWQKSINKNPLLYEEFRSHVRNCIKSNPSIIDEFAIEESFCLKKFIGGWQRCSYFQ